VLGSGQLSDISINQPARRRLSASYTCTVDSDQVFAWGASTDEYGDIDTRMPNIQLAGSMTMTLSQDSEGTIVGASVDESTITTIPTKLTAYVDNPIFFLPNLVDVEVDGVALNIKTAPFDVEPSGDFDAEILVGVRGGATYKVEIFSIDSTSGVIDEVPPEQSVPIYSSGKLTMSGTDAIFTVPVEIDIDVEGTGDFYLSGDVKCLITDVPLPTEPTDFKLMVDTPSETGRPATFTFTVIGGEPSVKPIVAYSLKGLGSTNVPQLGVTLDLKQPKQLPVPTQANGNGVTEWSVTIPANAPVGPVFFQALKSGSVSNVVEAEILPRE